MGIDYVYPCVHYVKTGARTVYALLHTDTTLRAQRHSTIHLHGEVTTLGLVLSGSFLSLHTRLCSDSNPGVFKMTLVSALGSQFITLLQLRA